MLDRAAVVATPETDPPGQVAAARVRPTPDVPAPPRPTLDRAIAEATPKAEPPGQDPLAAAIADATPYELPPPQPLAPGLRRDDARSLDAGGDPAARSGLTSSDAHAPGAAAGDLAESARGGLIGADAQCSGAVASTEPWRGPR
jgi:hypothetical protein